MGRPAGQGIDLEVELDKYVAMRQRFVGNPERLRSREVAYEAIKGAILAGLLEPRERLIEERLGAALDLSRTPIREALAILEHEGLIEAIPHKGLVVRDVSVAEFLAMYEALGVIEAAVARAAAQQITGREADHLERVLDDAERRIPDDVPGHLAACREFQRRLGEVSRSPFLTRQLVAIEERSDMYLIHSRQPLPPDNMTAAVHDRRRILEAVRAGDADAAACAAEAHAESIRVRWKAFYAGEPSPGR